jgi:ABC-type branched-subunit amino acid transport system substrate-binding protein/thioredoxin-like negative regulator of GroEL
MNRIAAALLLLLVSCGPKRTVLINGQTVPYEEAAGEEFRKAKSQFDQGHFDEAAEGFRRFLQKFPESELSDEALYRRGQALSRAGKQVEAQSVLQMLLEQRPNSPFKKAAALELGLVQSKLGVKQDSESLRPMVADMSDKERQQAAASLFEAYTKSGQAGEAARWAAKAVEASPEGPEREARLKDLDTALESAPAPDVAQLVADLSRSSPAWPAAALKLARIQLHTGDRTHAAELAAQILSTTGGTGPYADGARAVQRSVQASAMIKPNLVGIVLPLSGDLKGFADQALNAVALTLDLQGRGKIQVEVKDTKGEPDVAADAVEELAQKGAIAILGPLGVAEGLAAATRAQQLGIPIVSLSRAEGLTALGNYVFRDMPTSSSQAKAVADYAQKKLAVKRFAILQPDSPYGDEMAKYFWDAVDAGGAEVRAYEHYPLRTTTFKPFVQRMVGRTPDDLSERQEFADEAKKIADQIKDTYKRRKALALLKNQQAPIVDFDALFIPDAARTVRLVAPAVASEDVITAGCDVKELEVVKKTTRNEQLRTVQLLGTSLWDSPDLVDERSGVARYVQCSIFIDTFYPQSERPATRKFVDDYNNAYHRNPSFLEAHAFDAAGLLKKAYEDRHPGTREEMREALAGMSKPLEGAAGDTVFGKDREGQKPFFWLWINRGTIQEFDPEGPPPVPPAAPPPPPKEPPKPR